MRIFYSFIIIFYCGRLIGSCCSSSNIGTWTQILPYERAVIELSSGLGYRYGFFDDKKHVFARPTGLPYLVFVNELLVAWRVIDWLEPFVRLPWQLQKSDQQVDDGFSNLSLGAISSVVKQIPQKFWPSLTLMLGADFPVGKMSTNPKVRYQAGIMLVKTWSNINFAGAYNLSFNSFLTGHNLRKEGLSHAPIISVGFSPHENGYLSLALSGMFKEPVSIHDKVIFNTGQRKFSIASTYTITLHTHIKLKSAISFDMPYGGKNTSSEVMFKLGMRMGIF